MEIGKIKWCGHYNSHTGDYNQFGYLNWLNTMQDIKFFKKSVVSTSQLLSMFNNSDGREVVFELSGHMPVNVQYLDEVSADVLAEKLSPEAKASQAVQRLLLEKKPDALLGKDIQAYFMQMDNMNVRKLLKDKIAQHYFPQSVSAALSDFFAQEHAFFWSSQYWKIADWTSQPVTSVRSMCRSAIHAGVDIAPVCITVPDIWKGSRDFVAVMPDDTLKRVLTNSSVQLEKAEFEMLMDCVKSNDIKEILCKKADPEWLFSSKEYLSFLSSEDAISLLKSIRFSDTSPSNISKAEMLFERVENDPAAASALASCIEDAWITEESLWWSRLPKQIQDRVLSDYKAAGLTTESNATVNPELDAFLDTLTLDGKKLRFSVQQREAIQAIDGVTLLFAVPGSGKTTVIVGRAGYMAYCHQPPIVQNHLIMTFNKAAQQDMKSRYARVFSLDQDKDPMPEFRTLHSFCFMVIASLQRKNEKFPLLVSDPETARDPEQKNKHDLEVAKAVFGQYRSEADLKNHIRQIQDFNRKRISEKEAEEIICVNGMNLLQAIEAWKNKDITQKNILRRIMNTAAYDQEANVIIDTICTLIGYIKNRMLSTEEIKKITFKTGKEEKPISPIYEEYQKYLRQEDLMDYDDMLFRAYQGLKKYPDLLKQYQDRFPYVSLDEAQDTSLLQHEIVNLLVKKHGNLFMVGDDDQSIYAFRGAVPSEMLGFQKRYSKGRKLLMGTNYRSDIHIVRTSDTFVQANQHREKKLMRPNSKEQGSVQMILMPNASSQYEYIANEALNCINSGSGQDMAVLFRWNISALPIMAYLYNNKIPFYCSKQKEAIDAVLTRQEVKRILLLLRYCQNLESKDALLAACHICYRNIISKDELTKISFGKRYSQSWKAAIEEYLKKYGREDKITSFRAAYNEVLRIASAKTPRTAISYAMANKDYGIVSKDGDNGIAAWMRMYAVLSIADACPNTGSFLSLIDMMQNSSRQNWHETDRRITLSAMHSAKGREFDQVIIIDALDEITPGPEAGNDVWYDAEEERRLFYVAMTRARHQLKMIVVDVYHDRHFAPSRFISDVQSADRNVEVISYKSQVQHGGMLTIDMPHLAVNQGPYAGIYAGKENIEDIKKKLGSQTYKECNNYVEAIIYMHKSKRPLQRTRLQTAISEPQNLPADLQQRIWGLFGVNGIDELSSAALAKIQKKCSKFYLETGVTDYSRSAAEYALLYLPINMYKVWKPLAEMILTARIPVEGTIRILEIGAGPGTSTLGLLYFYKMLADENPDVRINIDYQVIEREKAFIPVFDKLVKVPVTSNFKVNIRPAICEDALTALKKLEGQEYDLILESNMINPNEHVEEEKLTELMLSVCRAVRNYGSVILIEPAGPEMMKYIRTIIRDANKTGSLLHEIAVNDNASVDLSQMKILDDVISAGLRKKDIDSHGFCYAQLERKDIEVIAK